jgi:hypothetical protein
MKKSKLEFQVNTADIADRLKRLRQATVTGSVPGPGSSSSSSTVSASAIRANIAIRTNQNGQKSDAIHTASQPDHASARQSQTHASASQARDTEPQAKANSNLIHLAPTHEVTRTVTSQQRRPSKLETASKPSVAPEEIVPGNAVFKRASTVSSEKSLVVELDVTDSGSEDLDYDLASNEEVDANDQGEDDSFFSASDVAEEQANDSDVELVDEPQTAMFCQISNSKKSNTRKKICGNIKCLAEHSVENDKIIKKQVTKSQEMKDFAFRKYLYLRLY